MKPENNFTISRQSRRVSVADALDAVSKVTQGLPSAVVFEHGSLQVKMYRPNGKDAQQPHSRDELYVVARGSGWFVNGPERHPFQSGDMLFVPAGVVHRFDEFSKDFCAWVVFYGPEDGERPGSKGKVKGKN
jgi:mannose-6-phosphate isomerase-like protein (cupin superfamily)